MAFSVHILHMVCMTFGTLFPSYILLLLPIICLLFNATGQAGEVFEKQRGDFMKDVVATGERLSSSGSCVYL